MLALEVEYLMGRVLATDRGDRARVEWPPHPGRLFSALVAALHEGDLDEAGRAEGRAALEWLETLAPPSLHVDPPGADGVGRAALPCWVPINDPDHRKPEGGFIAEGLRVPRKRAERYFPALTPNDARVWFIWPTAEADDARRAALAGLAERVGYLGHSASPVRVCVRDADIPEPNLVPDEAGAQGLRVPGPGRLARLEETHAASVRLGRRLEPPTGRVARYGLASEVPAEAPAEGLYRIVTILRPVSGPGLPTEAALKLVLAVRGTVLATAADPRRPFISGHEADGTPTHAPHLALAALPDCDHRHADGHLMGLAVLTPRTASADDIDALEEALAALPERVIRLGALGEWRLDFADAAQQTRLPAALRAGTWTRPACEWVSATPVVFGHRPRPGNPAKDATAVLARTCADVGLPAPEVVAVGPFAQCRGIPPASAFRGEHKLFRDASGPRFVAHVGLRFAVPVRGPVVLGAGRFFGMGLFRPLNSRRGATGGEP